jgi:hypothetical protein
MTSLRTVLTATDIDTYLEVRNRVHPEKPISLDWVVEQRKKPDNLDLIAERDGAPVGVATVSKFGGAPPAHSSSGASVSSAISRSLTCRLSRLRTAASWALRFSVAQAPTRRISG